MEIVRGVYEAINRRDWDAMFRNTHPDFEMTTQRGLTAGTHRGRERVTEFAQDFIATVGNLSFEPDELIDGGDQVVALVTVRTRLKGGDVDLVVRNGHLWTIRVGEILSMTTFPEPEKALEAAGLSE